MIRAVLLALAAMLLFACSASEARAQGQCSFCGTNPPPQGGGNGGGRPGNGSTGNGQGQLDLTIESSINFGRLVMVGTGVGSVLIDLQTGQKFTRGQLNDLGGIAVRGQALVTGKPSKAISVSLPLTITMSDPAGGQAELRDFKTDLSALPTLDANGRLVFHFTGTLYTGANIGIGGTLRGRIPIRVQYN